MAHDDIDKIKADERALQERKKSLIEDLLKQKEAAIKDFDDKLAQLGYQADGVRQRRLHRRKATPPVEKKP